MVKLYMKLAFVVTTIGRAPEINKLCLNLSTQLEKDDELIVVAQANQMEIKEICSKWKMKGLNIFFTVSGRGASVGRNVGVKQVKSPQAILLFPNDTTYYPPGTLKKIKSNYSSLKLGGALITDEGGDKSNFPNGAPELNKQNVWAVLEAGILIEKQLFDRLGGFDPNIGTGSSSPWQAGEVTDLLLRFLHSDSTEFFYWLPRELAFSGVGVSSKLTTDARRLKLRAYSRGIGNIYRRWDFPLFRKLKFLAGGLIIGLRRPQDYRIGDWPWAFVGRLEGITNITLSWQKEISYEAN